MVPTPDVKTKSAPETLPIDVDAALAALAAESGQSLDYQASIVGLLNLLSLDSGLSSRKELARELRYSGSEDDTGTMDTWLHAEVMTKLSAEGGVIPDEWKH